MHTEVFQPEKGDRKSVPNIGIVLTDGLSTIDPLKTLPESAEARGKDITMIAIGIGSEVIIFYFRIVKKNY